MRVYCLESMMVVVMAQMMAQCLELMRVSLKEQMIDDGLDSMMRRIRYCSFLENVILIAVLMTTPLRSMLLLLNMAPMERHHAVNH